MSDEKKKGPPTLKELEDEGKLPWKPLGEPYPYNQEDDLYDAIRGFMALHISLNDPRYYDVLTAWVLHTWHVPKWRATGPLYLLGPISSGKTTVLECLEEVAFRGIRGGSMTNATMFRLSHAYQPTLLIDESQVYNRDEWAETQAFLNERYRKGGRVWRMEGEGRNMTPAFFEAYGATAFAGSSPPWEALTSRAVLIKMEKGMPGEQTLTDSFFEQGRKLRAQLQVYAERWKPSESEDSDVNKRVDVVEQQMIDEGKLDIRVDMFPDPTPELIKNIRDYRVREIGKPLLQVAPIGEARENILAYLRDLEVDHEAEEQTGYLADYVYALDRAIKDGGKVSAKEIKIQLAAHWDMKTDSKDLPKPRTIMAALKTLGFHPIRMTGGLTGIIWSEPLMKRLRARFSESLSSISSLHEAENPSQVKIVERSEDIGGLRPEYIHSSQEDIDRPSEDSV